MTVEAGSGGAPGNPDGQAAPQGGEWTKSLPAELAPLAQAKAWKDPAEAVRSYAALEKLVGAARLAVPGKDAKPEEWDQVWNTLGRPEKPEKYSFEKPKDLAAYDDDFATWYRGAAHKVGMTDAQAKAFHDGYVGWFVEQMQADVKATETAKAAAMSALQKEWGGEFEGKKAMALEAVVLAGDPKLKDWFDKSGIGDDPNMIRLMAGIGSKLQEAGVKGVGGSFGASKETALAEIVAIHNDSKHAYHLATHPEHQAAVDRMQTLYKIAHPEPAAS